MEFVNPWGMESWQAQNVLTTESLVSTVVPDSKEPTKVEQQAEAKIVNVYWAKDTSGTPVDVVDFDENVDKPIAYAIIQTQNVKWKRFTLVLRSEDHTDIAYITKYFNIESNSFTAVGFTSKELFNGSNNYFLEVWDISGNILYSSKLSSNSKIIILNPVRSVPYILDNLGNEYYVGSKFQKRWIEDFHVPTTNSQPEIDAFPLSWVQNNSEKDKGILTEFFKNKSWENEKAKIELAKNIKKMFTDGTVQIGDEINDSVDVQAYKIVRYTSHFPEKGDFLSPLFDRYYFQSFARPTNWSDIGKAVLGNINPVFTALGSYSIRCTPIGKLKRISDKVIEFHMEKVGIYIVDTFEFLDDQKLGWWSPSERSYNGKNSYFIENWHYREYQQRTRRGRDFAVFSELTIIDTDIRLTINE